MQEVIDQSIKNIDKIEAYFKRVNSKGIQNHLGF